MMGRLQSKLIERLLQALSHATRHFLLADMPHRLADRIRVEQVNVLSTLVGVMSVVGQGCILLVMYEFWNTDGRLLLTSVGAVVAISYAVLVGMSLRWNGIWLGRAVCTAEQALRRYVWTILVLGVAWGILFIGLMPFSHGDERSLLYAIIIGLMSAGVLVVPVSAALVFWLPITPAAFIATTLATDALDFAGVILLVGYSVMTMFCILYLNRILILRALGEIEHQEGRETIGLLLRDFEESACDWLWETDEGGRLTHVSNRFAQAARTNSDDLLGAELTNLLRLPGSRLMPDPNQSATGLPALAALMERRLPFRDFEICLQVGGETVWWSFTGKPKSSAQQVFEGYRGVGSDVTYVKRANDRARFLANYDELTGLANRRLFREILDGHFKPAEPPLIALLYLDLDRFKAVNDTCGHPTGDALLIAVARRMEHQVRASDVCARLGGDEFAIVLRAADASLAGSVAERLVAEISRPYVIDNNQFEVGVSIGIALASPDATSCDALLQNADAALYQAKSDGRGITRFYDRELSDRDLRRHVLQNDLPGAIARNELRLEFQPIFNLNTRQITAVEALVRWDRQSHETLAPMDFVPMAEASGIVDSLGEWVLERACDEARRLPSFVRLAVNVSPLQLRGGQFTAKLRSVLASTGLDPNRLELELTETAFFEMSAQTLDLLSEVRRLGVRINLDDFGVGQTSLGHLRRFPFSNLKIDRSFVQDLPANAAARAVVRGLALMATELGIGTIAEGIETYDQLELVQTIGCDEAQGFLLARPMPLESLLRTFDTSLKASVKPRDTDGSPPALWRDLIKAGSN